MHLIAVGPLLRFRTRQSLGAGCFALFLLLLGLPTRLHAQFDYTTNNGSITITGYLGAGGPVTVPGTIDGLPVTRIGDDAFRSTPSLTSVTLPNSVTNLGVRAFFDCTNLVSIELGNGLTHLGDWTFYNCISLTSVVLPQSITGIGAQVFLACSNLTNISIPDGVTNIGNNSFQNCSSLTSVALPSSVTSIGSYAFRNCSSLTSIALPHSVTNLGTLPFADCSRLTAITVDALNPVYSSVAGVLIDDSKSTLIQFPGAKAGSYTIPSSVTNIGEYAFLNCSNLTSLKIGNRLTSIGYRAFFSCSSLTGVFFEGNVPLNVGSEVFYNANSAIIYYLPGTTGWSSTFAGRPTVLWNPQVSTSDATFGVRTNQFGFIITGTSGLVIVVEACTNLVNPLWAALQTNTLSDGASYFSDPQWTNYPARFYRFRSP